MISFCHFELCCYYSVFLCVTYEEPALPSVLHVETEREIEVIQQLKQANDTITRLQDELRRAAVDEGQLQKQLFRIYDQLTPPLLEKVMKDRDSKIYVFIIPCFLEVEQKCYSLLILSLLLADMAETIA